MFLFVWALHWYSFCCRIESYPNVQHVCQPTTRSNRLFLIHQMKLSVTTSLHRSLHLSNRLIQCCSHCCKNSPILIMDAVVKPVNQILWCLKWLVCICTMNCFMRQVQKEWFGGVVWVDQIYSMVCEHIGAVVSPLVMHRLQNLKKGILKYSFSLKKCEEVILKERDKMGLKSWIAGKTWCGIKCVGEKSDSPYTSIFFENGDDDTR